MTRSRSREAREAARKASQGIDLSDPLVAQYHKSKKARAIERAEKKKEKERRAREAMKRLAEQQELLKQHRSLVEEDKKKEEQEKKERKVKVTAERREIHRRNAVVKKEKERALVNYQETLQEEFKKKQMDEAKKREKESEAARKRRLAEEKEWQERIERGEDVAPCRTKVVHVERTEEMEQARRQLPILNMEQEIMEAVGALTTNALILCGETGSGKTTQLPQFLWEAGYASPDGDMSGMIGVTQPRRVAARSVAKRVAEELNVEFGEEVSYQVRYDHNLSEKTRVKFMTEGILLKEIQQDILLRQYSAILLDEAHERSIATDLLLGLLSRIVRLRWELHIEGKRGKKRDRGGTTISPLKLIIMSATLQVDELRDNSRLFPVPPGVINVEARQYPVSVHFAKRTAVAQYMAEAVHKVKQIHTKLPPGGILVFLPTQRVIEQVAQRLRAHFAKTRVNPNAHRRVAATSSSGYYGRRDRALDTLEQQAEEKGVDEWGLRLDDYELDDLDDASKGMQLKKEVKDSFMDVDIDEDASSEELEARVAEANEEEEKGVDGEVEEADEEGEEVEEVEEVEEMEDGDGDEGSSSDEGVEEGELDTLHVLQLYAMMNPKLQHRVFDPVPEGKRLCVVATNVAETSITIPGIKYVVDSGRAKIKRYDPVTGISRFEIDWISKASAQQRAGRAGRVSPGHAYRLYSTAVFANHCADHTVPEILQSPLESIVLFIKSFWDRSVLAFPFPTPPPREGVQASLKHLARLGALTETPEQFVMCPLGREVGKLPILPRFGKILVLGKVLWEGAPSAEVQGWLRGVDTPPLSKAKMGEVMASLVSIVSVASSATDVFLAPATSDSEEAKRFRAVFKKYRHAGSDYLTALAVLRDFLSAPGDQQQFCTANFLMYRNMRDAVALRKQLVQILASENESIDIYATLADEEDAGKGRKGKAAEEYIKQLGERVTMPSDQDQMVVLRKLVASGLIDQVARKATPHECAHRKPPVPYNDTSTRKTPYIQVLTNEVVYIHPLSSVATAHPAPEWVVYTNLHRNVTKKKAKNPKVVMKGVTAVRKEWLTELGWEGV